MNPTRDVQTFFSIPDAEWDAFVSQEPTGHFLQSAAWGHFKSRWGWRARRVGVKQGGMLVGGAQILFRPLPLRRSIAYLPRGPVVSPHDTIAAAATLEAVHRVCRKEGALLLTVEPNWVALPAPTPPHPESATLPSGPTWVDLAGKPLSVTARSAPHGPLRMEPLAVDLFRLGHFRPAAKAIQPSATILLDLRPSEEEILGQMHQKWRYNIRLATRKDITVRVGGAADFDTFHALTAATGERDAFATRPRDYYADAFRAFGEGARLFLAEWEGKPLAAIFVVKVGRVATYLYGASSNEERNRMPNHLLQWTAIQWARSEGCHWYDFWGIPPEVPEDGNVTEWGEGGLWGVFRFKQGFGGQVVKYPAAFDHPYSRLGYFAYQKYLARRGGGGE